MTKTEFCRALAAVESYNMALRDLLSATTSDHFTHTEEGARKEYEKYHKDDEGACALAWMNEHYDSIYAHVYAVLCLSEATQSLIDPLWSAAQALIPDKEETSHDS